MKIRIGVPTHLAAQPLVYGLARRTGVDIDLVRDRPARLAYLLERGVLDTALVPSIEYLRGAGARYVLGPALIARGRTGAWLLASDRLAGEIRRIAVDECSRTSLAVLRVVLDKLHRTLPDFCVFKGMGESWRESYDAILLTADRGIEYRFKTPGLCRHVYDVCEMWSAVTPRPLVPLLWAYNEETLRSRIEEIVTESRDFGIRNLSIIAEELASSRGLDEQFVCDYLSSHWGFDMGAEEEAGLRVLEEFASEYQLIQSRRLVKAIAG